MVNLKKMGRKYPIATGEIYHVVNKSIAGFQIFNNTADYNYLLNALRYFSLSEPPYKFSYFLKQDEVVIRQGVDTAIDELLENEERHIQLIAYCIMPTHIHILCRQLADDGLSLLLRKALNAYSRYFNIKYNRKGPLWTGRFKNVPVTNDEQLLHVSRYIHLNPVTSGLVNRPNDWPYSSYLEYVTPNRVGHRRVSYDDIISVRGAEYIKFCEDQAAYQKELAAIKNEALE